MAKKRREQNTIHPRITAQDGVVLTQAEVKQRMTDLFALLLEMHIDQNDVKKEQTNENKRCSNYSRQT